MKITLTVEIDAELGNEKSSPEELDAAAQGVCRQALYALPGYATIQQASYAIDGGPSAVLPPVR